jgi:hypothetical protein
MKFIKLLKLIITITYETVEEPKTSFIRSSEEVSVTFPFHSPSTTSAHNLHFSSKEFLDTI